MRNFMFSHQIVDEFQLILLPPTKYPKERTHFLLSYTGEVKRWEKISASVRLGTRINFSSCSQIACLFRLLLFPFPQFLSFLAFPFLLSALFLYLMGKRGASAAPPPNTAERCFTFVG